MKNTFAPLIFALLLAAGGGHAGGQEIVPTPVSMIPSGYKPMASASVKTPEGSKEVSPIQENKKATFLAPPPPPPVSQRKPENLTGGGPSGRDKLYFSFGVPTGFSYYNPFSEVYNYSTGGTDTIEDGATLPDAIWQGGLQMGLGFEHPLNPFTSLYLEGEIISMDLNEAVGFNLGPTKAAANFYDFLVGLKENILIQNPVSPYISFGLGAGRMHFDDITFTGGFFGGAEKPELDAWRFLYETGLGLDIRCDSDLWAFTEIQLRSFDVQHIFSSGAYASGTFLRGGLRLGI